MCYGRRSIFAPLRTELETRLMGFANRHNPIVFFGSENGTGLVSVISQSAGLWSFALSLVRLVKWENWKFCIDESFRRGCDFRLPVLYPLGNWR